MKTSILLEEVLQNDLRPTKKYAEYSELLRKDAEQYLKIEESSSWENRNCPGCGQENIPESFHKDIFTYCKCEKCQTLYVDPVPDQQLLDLIRMKGESAAFRKNLFEEFLSPARYQHLLLGQLQWITMTLDEQDVSPTTYFDYFPNDSGWMHLVIQNKLFDQRVTVVSKEELSSGESQTELVVTGVDDLTGKANVISAFGVMDKLSDPIRCLDHMINHLADAGLLFLSTTTSSGLEYQLLGKDAPSLIPLDRLTLFSTETLQKLLETRGMQVVEMSTPGRLDVEMMKTYFQSQSTSKPLPFWDYFFAKNDPQAFADFQLFLQKFRMSSHLRLVAKKRG